MAETLAPWLPFALSLGGLLLAHRLATHVLISFFYRLTHSISFSMLLYALLVWPGTALHEGAHWITARLLGVRASAPHLIPGRVDEKGRMVLGHVMIARTDLLRRSLIGAAPLFFGSAAVVLVARHAFALPFPAQDVVGLASLRPLLAALPGVFEARDAWLYLYALFAIANAMLPSPSDREAWPMLGLFVSIIAAALLLVVGVPQLPAALSLWGLRVVGWLTFAFALTAVIDGALFLVLLPAERLLHVLRGG